MSVVFCDRASIAVAFALVRMRLRASGPLLVHHLDPLPLWLRHTIVRRLLRAAGVEVREASFFAGHLRTADAETVYNAARRAAMLVAFSTADRVVRASPLLSRLDALYRPGTLACSLARVLWVDCNEALIRLLVTQALAGKLGIGGPVCLLRIPPWCSADDLRSAVPGVTLQSCRARAGWFKAVTLPRLLAVAYGRSARLRLLSLRGTADIPAPCGRPGVLTVQHDDLGTDCSYRNQPHWVTGRAERPAFDTYVLVKGPPVPAATRAALVEKDVTPLDEAVQGALLRSAREHPLGRTLARQSRECLRLALVTSSPGEYFAAMQVLSLLVRARLLVGVCRSLNISAFVTGENYLAESDAMQLVAAALDVRTVSYQYSNVPFFSTPMVTTADAMLIFSDLFQQAFARDLVGPGEFREVGYPFDGAITHVRARAERSRRQLQQAGATFVLGYFDESVQHDRYGLVASADHRSEILELAGRVERDPGLAVVIKTQFVRNTPSQLYPDEPLLKRVVSTGRYLELVTGSHRNIVLPCEAALIADVVVGHAFGGTAALESAVAGRRTILVDAYGARSLADHLYRSADVLYDSLGSALAAVEDFRRGDARRGRLGDWSAFIAAFDPFRDGAAADRIYDCVKSMAVDRRAPVQPEPQAAGAR